MRTITVQMKVNAPADVNPGALFEWLSQEISRWHPANPLEVIAGSATVPAKRGPKESISQETRQTICEKREEGMAITQIAEYLCLNRGIVQRTLKAAKAA